MNDKHRGSWYLLTGLIIGLGLGLLYSLNLQPIELTNAEPASLTQAYKEQYRELIALAYMSNDDPVRAIARLELLGDDDIYQALIEQAQFSLTQDNLSEEARALGILAIELGKTMEGSNDIYLSDLLSTPDDISSIPPAIETSTQQSIPPTDLSPTPNAAIVLVTPTPISADLFILQNLEKVCEPKPQKPLFQIEAYDQDNQPLPSVLIILKSEKGEERLYTGMTPNQGVGYAEFYPLPGVIYSLRLEENGIPIQDLMIAECQNSSGETYPGSWIFQFIKT